MKYKLIDKQTNEEHLCNKVTIDGFDYYVDDFISDELDGDLTKLPFKKLTLVAVATNKPNIDIPQILEEPNETLIHQIAADLGYRMLPDDLEEGIKAGYKKSQEIHPFSEKDMIEFGLICAQHYKSKVLPKKSFQEIFEIWEEHRLKIVYYE